MKLNENYKNIDKVMKYEEIMDGPFGNAAAEAKNLYIQLRILLEHLSENKFNNKKNILKSQEEEEKNQPENNKNRFYRYRNEKIIIKEQARKKYIPNS